MTRTRVRSGRCAAVAIVGALALLAGRGGAGAGAERRAAPRIFVVHRGDTVWSIAVRAAGPAADPRPIVDRLIEENQLFDAHVSPGTRLVLGAP